MRKCSFPGCGHRHYGGGLCLAHYTQQYRGLALAPIGEYPKGHWPEGKRRKPPTGIGVKRVLAASVRQRGVAATARLLGSSARTIRRWITGERYPNIAECRRIHEVCAAG